MGFPTSNGMNDDDLLKPLIDEDGDNTDEDLEDDLLTSGKKSPKKTSEDESLDAMAEEEDVVLPEDEFDDKDLW